MNTYLYAEANPNRFIDPLGLSGFPAQGIPCFGLGCLPVDWPDWMREPQCLECDDQVYTCLSSATLGASSCRKCALTAGADKLSCASCASSAVEGVSCIEKHCSWKACDEEDCGPEK